MDAENRTTRSQDWWFDGACAFRNGFDRAVPDRVPVGEPTRLWLEGWNEAAENANA